MKIKHKIRKWLSVVLCVCMLAINIDSTAFADGENPVSSLGHNPETGEYTVAEKTVLLAGNKNSLKGDTLAATIQAYRKEYLLGIAADFSVFLAGDFTPTDSDTEGRAAIGGNIILSELHWEGKSYAFGAGDYRTRIPLDTLLSIKNGTGTATVILGGEVINGQLSDVYYEDDVKYESASGDDGLGGIYANPLRKSSKILVLNTNGGTPAWVTSNTVVPDSSYQVEWQKMDLSQTYVTKLFDFTEQFDYLKETSNKLPQLEDAGNTVTYENNVITFKYGGDPKVEKECVYFNIPANMLNDFAAASQVKFENIPDLPNRRTVIDRDGNPRTWEKSYIVVNIDGAGGRVELSPNGEKNTSIGDVPLDGMNYYGVTSLMYNVYNATEVYLANGNFQGTVFAPGAEAKDNSEDNNQKHGHLSGALIAQSFKGGTEFGYYPFTGPGLKEGNLKVSKTVTGNAGDKAKDFTFTVTLDNKSINGTYGDMIFTNGVATFELKHGESKTATGLPAGIEYKVEESDNEGYTVTSTGETGTIAVGSTAAAEFTNYKAKGDLIVSKTVKGNVGETNKDFKFTVTLGDNTINGTYSDLTFTNGVAEFKLKHGESRTIEGLPAGVIYTVVESDNEGYKVTSTGEKGTIPEGETAKAEFTNYKATGSLTVTKAVIGNQGSKEKDFTFTVTLDDETITGKYSDVEFTAGVATIDLKHGESKTIEGLPAGIGYTVEENMEDSDGYTVTSEGEKDTIPEGKTATAAFTNIMDESGTGDLVVSKTVTGNGGDPEEVFTFTVTLKDETIDGTYNGVEFTDGVATIDLKHGESKTIEGLPAGIEYTVEEEMEDSNGYTVTSKDAKGKITGGSITGSIENNNPAVVEFINHKDVGALTISKTVAGRDGDKGKYFTFTVTLGDGTINGKYSDVEFTDGVATIRLKHGESKTIEGLPAGIKYTVVENGNEGYTVTTKTGDSGTIPVGDEAVAEFTNTRDVGGLTVSKTVAGAGGDLNKEFTFTVTLFDGDEQATTINGIYGTTDDSMDFNEGVAAFTLKHGESKTATGLPAGITYTVAESGNEYYTVSVNGDKSKTIGGGTIEKGKTATAVFTNTRDAGNLTVSKTVLEAIGDKQKEFTFTVTLSDKTITGKYGNMEFAAGEATFTLKHGQSKMATGLPAGITYMVKEIDDKDYTVASEGETGTIEKDNPAKAEFTNTRNVGSLIVSKKVTGTGGETDKDFEFTVTLSGGTIPNGTYGDMTFRDNVATFTLRHGESKKATGLPTGISYTVNEIDAENYTANSTGETGTIEKDTEAKAEFTNTRKVGDLTVSKTVIGTAGDKEKEFTFIVTLDDETITGIYSDVEFTAGEATIKLKHGESKTIEGLPAGIGYTVEESDNEDYKVTLTGETGTIPANATAKAAFINIMDGADTGDLIVTKTVTGNAGDPDKVFTFTVTLGDENNNKTYDGVKFTAGMATIKLKHGESKTIEGLPAGLTYTVKESDNEGYTATSTGETGTITTGDPATAAFTNTRDEGSLEVSKTVKGTGADLDKEFTFTVTLSDTSITGTYGDMTFENGKASFTLKHGESKTARELPTEITYTVKETDYEDYTMTSTDATGTIKKDTTAEAKFINHRDAGNLTVSKTVAGTGGDKEQAFFFTVTLSDTTVNGTYGNMEFKNGVAKFTLKHGESKTAKGLLDGLTYKVVEGGNEDYTVTSKNETGTIQSGQTTTAAFTNSRGLTGGNLTVSKKVEGTDGDKEQAFTFTVTLSDKSINGIYGDDGDMEFKNGVATFTLKDGESKTAIDLPEGITYTVEESDNEGYTVTTTGETGTIPADTTAMAAFTNHRNLPKADLTVTETVIGDEDKDKEFSFTVTLEDDTINGTYGDMNFENGKASFTLKDGESKTAKDLPSGLSYTVVQTDNEGYTQSVTGETGKLPDGASVTAAFINTRNVNDSSNGTSDSNNTSASNNTSVAAASTEQAQTTVVLSNVLQTGDDSHLGLWIVLLTLALAGLGTGFYFKKKSSS